MRILVTGSRDWSDINSVSEAIIATIGDTPTSEVVIVHGACPTGADALAEKVAQFLGITTDPFPADWDQYGKKAGMRRNVAMVRTKPDVCLAFINPCRKDDCIVRGIHGSHGATHCSATARRAGIKTRFFKQRRGRTQHDYS